MAPGKLSKRYAKALFETALEQQAHEQVSRDLRTLANVLEQSQDLREVFRNPRVEAGKKRDVLTAALKMAQAHKLTSSFLYILLEKGRLPIIPAVAAELERRLDRSVGRISAEVTSATPLEAAELKAIQEALVSALGAKEVKVDASVDPDVLGGVITRIGNIILDGSVRTQMDKMRNHLLVR